MAFVFNMVSIRFPLLIVLLSIGTNVVDACKSETKLRIGLPIAELAEMPGYYQIFHMTLDEKQSAGSVDVTPFKDGSTIGGIDVIACVVDAPSLVAVAFDSRRVNAQSLANLVDKRPAELRLQINVRYVGLTGPIYLQSGLIGVTDGEYNYTCPNPLKSS